MATINWGDWALGLLAGVILLAVSWVGRIFWKKHEEQVSLEATLRSQFGPDVSRKFGGPILRTRICCRSKRPAKISRVVLSVQCMQASMKPEGQEQEFVVQEPRFYVDLLPLDPQNDSRGWVLDRDDVCEFGLPYNHQFIPLFVKVPSEQLSIDVYLFDGSYRSVFSGLRLLQAVQLLADQAAEQEGDPAAGKGA